MNKSGAITGIAVIAALLGGCKIDFIQQGDDEKLIGINNATYFIDDEGNIFEQKDGYFIEVPKFYLKNLNAKKAHKIYNIGGLPIYAKIDVSYRDNRVFFDATARVEYVSTTMLKAEKMSWSETCSPYDIKLVWGENSPDDSFDLPLKHSEASKRQGPDVPTECADSSEFEQAYNALYEKAAAMVDYNQKLEGVVRQSSSFYGNSAPFRSITLLFQESNMSILEADLDYDTRLTRNPETISGFTSEGSIKANPGDFLRIDGVHYVYRDNQMLADLIKELDELKAQFS